MNKGAYQCRDREAIHARVCKGYHFLLLYLEVRERFLSCKDDNDDDCSVTQSGRSTLLAVALSMTSLLSVCEQSDIRGSSVFKP